MRIPRLLAVTLTAAFCLLISCIQEPLRPEGEDLKIIDHLPCRIIMPHALFAKTYINWAWGYSHSGWYIDDRGYVDTFTYVESDSMWAIGEDGFISQPEMMRMMRSSFTDYRTIDKPLLDSMKTLAQLAASGPWSESISVCRDFGTITYWAFLYDSLTQRYSKYLLYQAGDWAQYNESEAGKILTELLFSIDNDGISPCRPF